jgi:hypothetical protein
MKKSNTFLFALLAFFLYNCGKGEKNNLETEINPVLEKIEKPVSDTTDEPIIKNDSLVKIDTLGAIEKNVPEKITQKKVALSVNKPEIATKKEETIAGFVQFRKMLSDCKIGEVITQKELIQNHNLPKDGVQLIKSITKITENEIVVKWNSTWLVEKVSSAKFTDGQMKMKFEDNKMYTSGNAIGIKHNKKIYTDLIIIGSSAYIPTVKGYHWQIGK